MKTETIIWSVILALAGAYIAVRTLSGHMGRSYVVERNGNTVTAAPHEPGARLSPARTVGLWMAAIFTLCIFSFLYGDNVFYKFAESVLVGVSAAYWMVVGFWSTIVPNLLEKLMPSVVQGWAMPGLHAEPQYAYVAPLVLGALLLWRLSPRGGWIARWPLAFIIGTMAGFRLVGFLQADFLSQIRNTIVPLYVAHRGSFDVAQSIKNALIVIGVLCGLVYFFFSIEHKGIVGRVSRVGIWYLMITFGAAFGYTVMGRIALLAIRLEFLFDDWLWVIDPQLRRAAGG